VGRQITNFLSRIMVVLEYYLLVMMDLLVRQELLVMLVDLQDLDYMVQMVKDYIS